MRIENGLMAVALAACLAAGTACTANTASAQTPPPLTIGQQVRGEITSADPVNHRDGTRSKLYRVDLQEGQGVTFSVEGALRAHLALFRDSDLVRSSSEDQERASLTVRAPSTARYTLAVSGQDASSYGPFTVKATALEVYDGSTLNAGASITDWADSARRIPLQIEHAGLYAVRMASDEFDPLLKLEGNGVSLENDDSGGSNNSLITARLEPGRYTITADGYSGQIDGQYQLSVEERTIPEGSLLAEGSELVAGRQGSALYQGRAQTFRISVPSRQMATLQMRSGEIDSYLRLSGQGVSLSDDDSGDNLDARITAILEPGSYTVQASTAGDSAGAGLFTLDFGLAPVPQGSGGGSLTVGEARDAHLVEGLTDRYTVDVRRAGDYVVEMSSGEIDSHLRLKRGDEEVAADDDSGGSLNARIEQSLSTGTYVIEASSAVGPQSGPYRIVIRRR
ncbi:hypothetical protein LDO32_01140 [Luteimonas sp. Y-2-2-4F]|nr:hypothetical protein [Luteimonas sp. Y-2-2-4F]MCD9030341.1 hypothetical protein [Luteimonas sp. Y-2-2-4F]